MPRISANQVRARAPDAVRTAYNEWVEHYDSDVNATRDLSAAVLRDQGLVMNGKRILEIGCGTGLNTAWLAARAGQVVGLDLAENMLAAARERLADAPVGLVQADITRPWPLRGTFDGAVVNLVLEHVEDLQHVFMEFHRLLAPGAFLFLAELHPFRQAAGGQARYRSRGSGQEVQVPAFRHSVSEFVNAGVHAGLVLCRMDERGARSDGAWRLLTLQFTRP